METKAQDDLHLVQVVCFVNRYTVASKSLQFKWIEIQFCQIFMLSKWREMGLRYLKLVLTRLNDDICYNLERIERWNCRTVEEEWKCLQTRIVVLEREIETSESIEQLIDRLRTVQILYIHVVFVCFARQIVYLLERTYFRLSQNMSENMLLKSTNRSEWLLSRNYMRQFRRRTQTGLLYTPYCIPLSVSLVPLVISRTTSRLNIIVNSHKTNSSSCGMIFRSAFWPPRFSNSNVSFIIDVELSLSGPPRSFRRFSGRDEMTCAWLFQWDKSSNFVLSTCIFPPSLEFKIIPVLTVALLQTISRSPFLPTSKLYGFLPKSLME